MMKNLKRLRPRAPEIEAITPMKGDAMAQARGTSEQPSAPPTDRRSRVLGIGQIVLVLALMVAAIYFSRAPATPVISGGMNAAPSGDAAPAQNAAVITPIASVNQVIVEGNGAVGVASYIDLVPQITGRIAQLAPAMQVGGAFTAGQVLLVLEQEEFLLLLRQALADVEVQRANLELQQAKSDAAVSNYGLINPGREVPSLVALRPQIAQARAQLQAAQSRADIARLNLKRTEFSLPFDGMITQSSAQVGQLVSSGKTFGQAYALGSVELTVPIAQTDLAQLAPAADRRVQVVTGSNRIDASIDRVSAELDSRSRFARVFVSLPQSAEQPQGSLKPGMFADVVILGPRHDNSLLLPEAAMQANGSIWFVRGGQLQQQKPTVLGSNLDGIVVQGFDIGEGIVVGNVPGAVTGMAITPIPYLQNGS
ncbi:MAG: efflux RND transporter periplasmic adaptor subunit [Proteobacteria bacterium]|nr:efflux RND transporter periplasmic adaptor subunit [Pseudomonadota bacterium]